MGVDSFGVGEGELFEGLFPVGDDLAFDESAGGSAFGGWSAAFFGAFSGSLVFDEPPRVWWRV